MLGDNQTPYLHLNLGTDEIENRNWTVLDRRLYDLARGSIANIPAGGDLAGFYPDPTLRLGAVTPPKLAPGATPGSIPLVAADGTFTWMQQSAIGGVWTDGGAALIPTKGVTYPVNCGSMIVRTSVSMQGAADGSTLPTCDLTAHGAGPTDAAILYLIRSRANTGPPIANDILGRIQWNGLTQAPGTYSAGAAIIAYADQPFTPTAAGSHLSFSVAPLGAIGTIERLRINPDGTLRASVDPSNALDLATKQYVDAHASSGYWTDDPIYQYLSPVSFNARGILLASGQAIRFADHAGVPGTPQTRSTGIKADDNSLILNAGSAGMQFKSWDNSAVFGVLSATNFSLSVPLTLPADPTAALQAATKQYVDAHGPVGPASGSLAGSYPGPTLTATGVPAGTYGTATAIPRIGISIEGRITSVSEVAISIPPSTTVGPTPPASPTQGQMWWRSDPDGNLYLWYNDGTSSQWVPATSSVAGPWSVSGSTLTPTDPTKLVAAPAAGTSLQLGSRTIKGRVVSHPTVDAHFLTHNLALDPTGATWSQDDASKPSWDVRLGVDVDQLRVERAVAGSPGTRTQLLTLGTLGNLDVLAAGATSLTRWSAGDTLAAVRWNRDVVTDSAKPCWVTNMGGSGASDAWNIFRAPTPGSGLVTLLTLDTVGNLTINGATATKASGTTWANPSDRRLKDDITDYPTGLVAILQLQPRTFLYNGKGGSQAGLRGYGYIADEAALVIPEMLSITKAKLDTDDEEDSDIQTLDTSNITLALVNAVKELASRVATLEAR